MQTHDKAKELLNCRKNHATLSASSVGDVEKGIITKKGLLKTALYLKQKITMITIIKKGASIEEMRKLLNKAFSKVPQKNVRKYAGALKTDIDPLEYQKQMRNEWEQTFCRY